MTIQSSLVDLKLAQARAFDQAGDYSNAEVCYRSLIGQSADTALKYGIWLQEQGRFEESSQILEAAIKRYPKFGALYLALAEGNGLNLDDQRFASSLVKMASDPDLDILSQIYISFAIGKSFDAIGRYSEAAAQFQIANDKAFQLHDFANRFERKVVSGYPDKVAHIYRRDIIDALKNFGSASDVPVFIIGMIRSGTTLLDQVVSAHRFVVSIGESNYWQTVGDQYNRNWYANGIEIVKLQSIQDGYFDILMSNRKGAKRVVNKMPLNFELVGMIHLLFPNAKFLHIRRCPADTALSIFQNYYGPGAVFAYSLENLEVYYKAYLRFMEHWKLILPPSTIFELEYESLVSNLETTSKKVIEFLGLEWDEQCLKHDSNTAPVSTPSKWQVRQPIYTTSVNKWHPYGPSLPQLEKFNELIHLSLDKK